MRNPFDPPGEMQVRSCLASYVAAQTFDRIAVWGPLPGWQLRPTVDRMLAEGKIEEVGPDLFSLKK
jgi:hypothetical protein